MRKRILAYRKHIDRLLQSMPDGINWEDVLSEHLQQISFFQHERLVHFRLKCVLTNIIKYVEIICKKFPLIFLVYYDKI